MTTGAPLAIPSSCSISDRCRWFAQRNGRRIEHSEKGGDSGQAKFRIGLEHG